MNIDKKEREEFLEKKKVLESARLVLKKEFVQLDDIIDEVISDLEPWFLFPKGQVRPTIINLWGMTGVGKTSLVKRLFELLDMKDCLYKFDVGDYASQNNTKLSYAFSDQLKNRENHQIGIIFDEFQNGRTIDETGSELEKSGLRAMWDLLDSGKISILQSSYYGSKIYQLSIRLADCVDNGNVECKNGVITKNQEYHDKFFKDDDNEKLTIDSSGEIAPPKKKDNGLFVPSNFYWQLQSIWEGRFISEREVGEYLKAFDQDETLQFLEETMKKAFQPVDFDYTKSCIFVIGNIDEAYGMSDNIDPDSDADSFYKNSLNITVTKIKRSLKKRFRSEQIARLGNNHVIYPAISSKSYKELINMELKKFTDYCEFNFDLSINIDKSVNGIIYKEGVFPTQGARPVFTTINSMISSYSGKIVQIIIEKDLKVDSVDWRYSRGKYTLSFKSKGDVKHVEKLNVKLKIDNLRKSDKSNMQAAVAVHESGHALASIYALKILPEEIISRSANLSEGHCRVELPDVETFQTLKRRLVVLLGGYCAERFVFGEDKLGVGTYSDISRATQLAQEMVKQYGMKGNPMIMGPSCERKNFEWNSSSILNAEQQAEELIMDARNECDEILKNNEKLLIKMAEYLSDKPRMKSSTIETFVKEFGEEVEFIDYNNYYSFRDFLKEKAKKI